MSQLSSLLSTDFLTAAVTLATPLLLAAIGGLFSERSGVINIALEGMMLGGALAGVIGAVQTGSVWLALVYVVLTGAAVGLLLAVASITFRADQIVAAVAINILMLGITSVLFRGYFGLGNTKQINAPQFQPWPIPGLSAIPGIGPALFDQIPLVYLAYALVPISWFVLYRTSWGLKVTAVGEHPKAADTVGVNVLAIRYACVIISGILAALGGAVLSIGFLNTFQDNMTAGRGFIAFSAIIFGQWTPLGTLIACLIFGAADAVQLRLQAISGGVPYQFLLMLPYLVTLIALFGVRGRNAPAAGGQAYASGE